jgi:hypothetical protein
LLAAGASWRRAHRGPIADDGWLSELGRAVKWRVDAPTDELAAKPYGSLQADELVGALEPLATAATRCPGLLRLGFDTQGRLLETALLAFDDGKELVIHAMKARPQMRDLLP